MEYLNQCQGEIEVSRYTAVKRQCLRLTRIPRVSLTIQSIDVKTAISSSLDEKGERDYQRAWNRWLTEVDQIEPSPSTSEPDEYGKALIEKYRKQGLEL